MSLFTGAAEFYQRFRPGIPAEVAAVLDEAAPQRSAGLAGSWTSAPAPGRWSKRCWGGSPTSSPSTTTPRCSPLLKRCCGSSPRRLSSGTCGEHRGPRGFHPRSWMASGSRHDLPGLPLARPEDRSRAPRPAGKPRRFRCDLRGQQLLGRWKPLEGSSPRRHQELPRRGTARGLGDLPPSRPPLQRDHERIAVRRRHRTHRSGPPDLEHRGHPRLPVLDLFAAPILFGDRLPEFEEAITERLTGFSDDDIFTEENEFLIRIGRRRVT